MSPVTQSQLVQPRGALRAHRALVIAAVVAAIATAAGLVAVFAFRESASTPAQETPAAVWPAGPSESNVAAAVGARTSVTVDEARVAASISGR